MKKLISLVLTAVIVLSLSVPVFAADNENITAILDRNIKVTYDGELQTFTDVNGKIVYPVVYEGTTYLPVRAVSGLVNLPVEWDGANYTVVSAVTVRPLCLLLLWKLLLQTAKSSTRFSTGISR